MCLLLEALYFNLNDVHAAAGLAMTAPVVMNVENTTEYNAVARLTVSIVRPRSASTLSDMAFELLVWSIFSTKAVNNGWCEEQASARWPRLDASAVAFSSNCRKYILKSCNSESIQ